MARPKKNGTYLNVCIETPIYERLEKLCEDAGQTKNVAVERALTLYLEDYEEKQKLLRAILWGSDSFCEGRLSEGFRCLRWKAASCII